MFDKTTGSNHTWFLTNLSESFFKSATDPNERILISYDPLIMRLKEF